MSTLSGYLLFAGRGVAGATFAIGASLVVEAEEVDVIADSVDTETVIIEYDSAELVLSVEEVDVVLVQQSGDLTVE